MWLIRSTINIPHVAQRYMHTLSAFFKFFIHAHPYLVEVLKKWKVRRFVGYLGEAWVEEGGESCGGYITWREFLRIAS